MFRDVLSRLVDDLDQSFLFPALSRQQMGAELSRFFDPNEVATKENVVRRLFLLLTLSGLMVYVPGLFSEGIAQSDVFELYGQITICSAFFAVLLYVGLNAFFVSAAGILAVNFVWLTNRSGDYEFAAPSAALLLYYSIARLRQKLSAK